MKKIMLFFLLAVLILGCVGCGQDQPEAVTTTSTTTAPATTASSTTTATVIRTETITTPPPPQPPEPEVFQNHSGLRKDLSFNGGTLFIGDSLTYGLVYEYLMVYENTIGDAKYMALVGAPIRYFFDDDVYMGWSRSLYSEEFYGMTFHDGVAAMGEEATAIYFMMGTNYDPAGTLEYYVRVVDYILEVCPNATVYLQLVPYSTAPHVDYTQVNDTIKATFQYYLDRGSNRVKLIDTFSSIGRDRLTDGVHLTIEGNDAWFNAIIAHSYQENIPE